MIEISDQELLEIYEFAIELGKGAGQILLDGIAKRRSGVQNADVQVEKENAVDIVTQTDEGEPDRSCWVEFLLTEG